MPLRTDEMISVLAQLAEQENMQVTVKESAKGACLVGSSAFAGGLLGGFAGLVLGGMVGSVASLWFSKEKYRPVADIILNDMTAAQKLNLAQSVQRIAQDLRVEDLALVVPMLMSNASLKELIIKKVISFIMNKMSLSVAA